MQKHQVAALTLTMNRVPSRRDIVRGLVGAGFGFGSLRQMETGEASKKKKTKTKPNVFGCLNLGQPCAGNSARCCSGICHGRKPRKGKKDTSKCAVHNTGICAAGSDLCTSGLHHACHPSNPNCTCTLTTGNAGFCADFTSASGQEVACRVCTRDTDCQAEFGAGAAC